MATGYSTPGERWLEARSVVATPWLTAWLMPVSLTIFLLAVAAPRFLAFVVPLSAGLCLCARPIAASRLRELPPSVAAFAAATLSVLMCGVLASPEPLFAAGLVAVWLGVVALGVGAFVCALSLRPQERLGVRQALIAAGLVGAAYLILEFTTRLAVIGGIYGLFPGLAGASKYTFIVDEGRELVRRHVLNRNVGVLALLLWPMVLAAVIEVRRGAISRAWVAVLVLLAGAAIYLSAHETSKVAFALGSLIFVVARARPKAAVALLATLWVAANFAVVPAVKLAYQQGLQRDVNLQGSARARITLWNYTASRIASSWVVGKGVDSVRLDDEAAPRPGFVRGELGLQRTGRHSHNVFLQIWYEFGVMGIALFTLAGLGILNAIRRRVAPADAPLVLSGFASAMVMLALSWGFWQFWYICALLLVAALFAALIGDDRRACPSPAETDAP